MKKLRKKSIAMLISLLLVLSLAACGGSSSDDTSDTSGDTASADAEETADYSGQTLVVANWQSYATDYDYGAEVFEEIYGCEVEHYYMSSTTELMQTLLNGGSEEIDVVNINPVYIQEYYSNGLIEAIDTTQLENYDNLKSDLAGIDDVLDENGGVLGIPWIWGTTSLFYNADEITEEITSVSALWDEQYAGKVGYFDDYETAIKYAAFMLGEDCYDPDLDAVEEALIDLKSNVKTYWSTYDDFMKAYTSGDIIIGNTWGSMATELQAEGYNIEYFYPEEGVVGWCDYWCLVSDSDQKDLAMEWINFCTGEDFQTDLATSDEQIYCPANQVVLDALSDETKQGLWIYPDVPDNMYLSLYMDSDTLTTWSNLWTEVKASSE